MAKAGNTITICSKLPMGLTLTHPVSPGEKVTIKGLNAAPRGTNNQPLLVPYMTTEVDADFWEAWFAAHGLKASKPFPAIKSGAMWMAKNEDAAKGVAKEREKDQTGLQPMDQGIDERMGRGANSNVRPADKD